MTLNQLEYFRKVATLQHYRLASEELNISQPSLSRSMALLEDEFQLILFEKQGRSVVLTKAGRGGLHPAQNETDCRKRGAYRYRLCVSTGKLLYSPYGSLLFEY